jgi:hypothetical protein
MEGTEVEVDPTQGREQIDSDSLLPEEKAEAPEAVTHIVDEAGKQPDSRAREEDPPTAEEEASKDQVGSSQGHEEELNPSWATLQAVQGQVDSEAEPVKEEAKLAEAEPEKEEAEPMNEEAEPVKEEAKLAEAEPVKEEAEPGKEEAKLMNEEAETVKEEAEPVKEEAKLAEADPVKKEAEPVKEEADPVKKEAEPVKEEADPVKEEAEPVKEEAKLAEADSVKEEAEPVKEEAEPVKEEAEPVKEVAEPVKEEAELPEAEPLNEDQLQDEEVKASGEDSLSISNKVIRCPEPSLSTIARSEETQSSDTVESTETRTMNKSKSAEQDFVHNFAAKPTDSEQATSNQAAPHVLEFTIHYMASFGDNLYITGNSPALGNWNPTEGLQLQWTNDNIWTGSAEVDSPELEYKYVCVGATETRWEGGPNHAISEHKSELSSEVSLVRDLWRD